jgi:hypothetical protein
MAKPISISERDSRLSDLLRRMELANSKEWGGPESHELLREYKKELSHDPRFIALVEQDRKKQEQRRAELVPAAWDRTKADALHNVRRFLSQQISDKRTVVECSSLIHIAACNYELHSRGVVAKLKKEKEHVVRDIQPAKTAVECLKRLDRALASTPYVWAKAWAAMSPAALEALIEAHPGTPVPIFRRAPGRQAIRPLLPGAIAFAARKTAQSQAKRDELIIATLIAYRLTTGKRPTLSKSKRNRTLRFIKSVEMAYQRFLPGGFNVPNSHSRLERLRGRSLG